MISTPSDPRWLPIALRDMDRVLVDHAHCEKKAAATAMSLVSSYPEHERLVRRLTALAIEELRHFRSVYEQLRGRGLALGPDPGDPYAQKLRSTVRGPRDDRLLDRLLVAGLIEARSCERLGLLAAALGDAELASMYESLARAEAGHATLFRDLAAELFPAQDVDTRLAELTEIEARIVAELPLEPRIH